MKTEAGEALRRYWRNRRTREKRRKRLARAREKSTHTEEQWESVRDWANMVCVRCGSDRYRLEKDHVVPLYKGGSDGIDNLQPICAPCNSSKGAETINWMLRDGYAI